MKREELGIPPFLYRGDRSFRDVAEKWEEDSKLREIYRTKPTNNDIEKQDRFFFTENKLYSKLLSGGDPYEIHQSVIDLIKRHVEGKWDKTHFISTTSNIDVAKRFMLEYSHEQIDIAKIDFENLDYYCDRKYWEYVLVTIDLRYVEFERVESGIYLGTYNNIECLLIHVVESGIDKYSKTYLNATRDSEWLILPCEKLGDETLSAALKLPQGSRIDFYTKNTDKGYEEGLFYE